MYQSIYYNRQPNDKQYHYYVRDDSKGISCFQYWPTLYRLDDEGEFEDLFGRRCSAFKGKYDRKDNTVLEKDIDRELVLLRDLYYKTDDTPSYHNTIYLDIEIEIIGQLNPQTIREANAEITAIALIDASSKEKICFVLDKEENIKNISEDGKSIISCKTEKDLIYKFLSKWEQLDPTIVVGFNSDFFDIPYLYYRLKKIVGDDVYRLSPIGIIDENLKNPQSPIKIGLVNCLDYMLLFKKYIMKEESSYKLGDIGTKYAKLGKIEYNGSLNQLFKEDPLKFIDYNIRDVEIIEALENKQKFIQLTVLISHLCHTPYESIYYNTVLNEGAILTYLKRKNIIAPNKPTTTNPTIKDLEVGDLVVNHRNTPTCEGTIISVDAYGKATIKTLSNQIIYRSLTSVKKKDSYAGGYLLEPIPGLYFDVSDLDFTSLYPSIIKSLNLGIETLVGRIITKNNYEQYNSLEQLKLRDPQEKIQIEKLNIKTYTLKPYETTIGELIEFIEENNLSISASGAFFRTDKRSIACIVLEDWFGKREYYRGLKKKAGKKEDWVNYQLYDLYQLAFKILQNALYGTYAINSWRFTDGFKICSAAITNSGQRLTKTSIDYVNKRISEEIQSGREQFICGSDTDSMYVELTDLLKYRYPNLDLNNREEKIKYLLQITSEIQSYSNENLNNICETLFNIKGKHYFELKQEVIAERVYWAGKRRYAMYIVNKEGISLEELDMKGLDIMKSNFPPLFREFGENLIKNILFNKSKQDIDTYIIDFRNSLTNIDWNKLMKPTGLKHLERYIKSAPPTNTIFSSLENKCPMNTKSAIYSNDLIKYYKQENKYHMFQIGDKIYTVYLKDNPYKIDVIALNGHNDCPQILTLAETYIDRSKMFDSVMKEKIEKIYNDLKWSYPVYNKNINKFFKFN